MDPKTSNKMENFSDSTNKRYRNDFKLAGRCTKIVDGTKLIKEERKQNMKKTTSQEFL